MIRNRFVLCMLLLGCSSDISDAGRSSTGTRGSQVGGSGATPSGNPAPALPPPGTTTTTPPGTTSTGTPMACPGGLAHVSLVTPTVWLVVDGSSSMDAQFGAGASRWQTLRSTLMGPGGVVPMLERNVNFGMVIYSGNDGQNECVKLVNTPPAPNNFTMLDAAYPMMPIGRGTPTDKALDHVFTQLPVLNTLRPDAKDGPVYVVLATDGAPNDSCGGGGLQGGDLQVEQRVVDVAMRATQMGAKLFIVSLAGDDARLQTHLEAVAAVTESKRAPFVPATQAELVTALRSIVGSGTCQLKLNGRVAMGQECMGSVTLNGTALPCGSADGWVLNDPSTLQLVGAACDSFLSQKQSLLEASFPCGVFVPQ